MTMFERINKLFGGKPRAFLVDDERRESCKEELDVLKSMNVNVDQFVDFKELLCKLQSSKTNPYKIGAIHQNGTRYPSEMLSNFIKSIDPTIKLIVYKNLSQLKKETRTMVLT